MKRIIAVICIMVMMLSVLVNAEGSTVFTVEPSVNGSAVTANITFKDNSLCYGFGFSVIYNNDRLRLTKTEVGETVKNEMYVINDVKWDDKVRLVCITNDVLPESGTVLTLTFNLLKDGFQNSDFSCEEFAAYGHNGQLLADFTMEVAGVEDSTIVSDDSVRSYDPDYKEDTETTTPPATTNPDTATGGGNGGSGSGSGSSNEVDVPDSSLTTDSEIILPADKPEATVTKTFTDVDSGDWFYDSVMFVLEKGLMGGVSDTEFDPQGEVTRGMLVTILHRLEGSPDAGEATFTDVEKDTWYTNAVAWASGVGIVNGVGDNNFAPNTPITREQIATILYNYDVKVKGIAPEAQAVGIIAPDADKISSWALDGMSWAISKELIKGDPSGNVNPTGNALRCEIATILTRYLK